MYICLLDSHWQVKPDKWAKMTSQDENVAMAMDFLDKAENRVLLILLTSAGLLQPSTKVGSYYACNVHM